MLARTCDLRVIPHVVSALSQSNILSNMDIFVTKMMMVSVAFHLKLSGAQPGPDRSVGADDSLISPRTWI